MVLLTVLMSSTGSVQSFREITENPKLRGKKDPNQLTSDLLANDLPVKPPNIAGMLNNAQRLLSL